MNAQEPSRRHSLQRPAFGVLACPACTRPVKAEAQWCPTCNFSGGDTLAMFPGEPPPLLPILDAAGVLTDSGIAKITAMRDALKRRFPQFQWRICTVNLPPDASLPLFGFWLMNACPLHENETDSDRAWTILLLINSGTGQAAVIPGYAAEPFVSDDEWKSILAAMTSPWREGKKDDAVIRFFQEARKHLERAWKRFGARGSHANPS